MWDWTGEDYYMEKDSHNELSRFLWEEVNQNELFCMLDEQTPVKDCVDLEHESLDIIDEKKKFSEDYRDSVQFKRRRMLKFTRDSSEQMNSSVFKSKVMECSMTKATTSEWNGDWPFCFQDDICALTCDELDDSSDGWLKDCLNEKAIRWSFDEMKNEVVVNRQADISDIAEYCDNSMKVEPDIVQKTSPAPIRVSEAKFGKQAFINPPRKLTDSVVYPFALIKPCGVHGDVTLNDINQRIHAPPRSSLKHKSDEDPSIAFPMSAFSGKPVVVKTKIRTEGGQGSITIMRTKG